ncbi:MAG: SUMF1/EgtB/PvdO family nonheme iron enzyme [Lysobacterales bacterium]
MAGASPIQQQIAGVLGLLVLLLACLYRWGDAIGFERAQVASHSPAVAATTASGDQDNAASPEATWTEFAPPEPELVVGPVRPDAIESARGERRAAAVDALQRAAQAREDGRWLAPKKDNALYWIDQALIAVPQSQRANAARNALIEALLLESGESLDSNDAEPASALITAIGEARGEFANELRALGERAARQRQVQRKLAEANERFDAGRVFAPPGASALDSYRAALALDPRGTAAQSGLLDVSARVLDAALTAAAQDEFSDAERLLDLATSIDTGNSAQIAARAQVTEVKQARAQALASRVRAALEARQLDLAGELLARLRAVGFDLSQQAVDDLEDRLEILQQYAGHAPGESFRDAFLDHSARGPDMVAMPLGEFQMGSPPAEPDRRRNEGPQRVVRIVRPFALARTETSVGEFAQFVKATAYQTDAESIGHSFAWDERTGRLLRREGVDWQRGYTGRRALPGAPVMHISWRDAEAYAKWLALSTGESYRLPSEAEFEFALRASRNTRFPWGVGTPIARAENVAGAADRSPGGRGWAAGFVDYTDGFWGPSPAGHLSANTFGLHDIAGNLSEWVADCWHDSYRRAPADGSAWLNPGCTQRVARGAAWGSSPPEARAAFRSNQPSNARSARLGMRVARDL